MGAARRHVGPRRRPVALAGAALAVAGCLQPLGDLRLRLPGEDEPGRVPRRRPDRTSCVLVVPALLCRRRCPRPAGGVAPPGPAASWPSPSATSLGIANDGGGFGAVAFGAWLAARRRRPAAGRRRLLPPTTPRRPWPSGAFRRCSRRAAVAASLGAVLAGVVVRPRRRRADPLRVVRRRRRLRRRRACAGLGVTGWLEACTSATGRSTLTASAAGGRRLPLHPGRHRPVDPGVRLHRRSSPPPPSASTSSSASPGCSTSATSPSSASVPTSAALVVGRRA